MNRPFAATDNEKLFRDRSNGAVGKLEFPLSDPGEAAHDEGILWYSTPVSGASWNYVRPGDVEELT